MGRILRKKHITKRKKEKQDSDGAGSSNSEKDMSAIKKVTESSVENLKKKQVLSFKKGVPSSKSSSKVLKNNYIEKIKQFLREVKVELKKVTWPSRKQAIGSTIVVLILVVIISFFLGLVDIGLSSLIKLVLG